MRLSVSFSEQCILGTTAKELVLIVKAMTFTTQKCLTSLHMPAENVECKANCPPQFKKLGGHRVGLGVPHAPSSLLFSQIREEVNNSHMVVGSL